MTFLNNMTVVLIATLVLSSASVTANAEPIQSSLADSMTTMIKTYLEIEKLSVHPKGHRKTILEYIDTLESTANGVAKMSDNKHVDKSLRELQREIKLLTKHTNNLDKEALHATLSRVYTNCFQCHVTHRPDFQK